MTEMREGVQPDTLLQVMASQLLNEIMENLYQYPPQPAVTVFALFFVTQYIA